MKHTVRAFSVGLLTAGLILLGVFFFTDGANNAQADISTEEMIGKIQEDGYRVITEEEYISFSVSSANSKDQEESEEAEETEETEETEENAEKEPAEDETEPEAEADDEEVNDEAEEDAEEEESTETEAEEEEEEEQTPSTVTITIEPGMVSSQISQMLEEHGIIEDAGAFTDYILEHDYSLRIQMGEHELETGMSHYEIAESLSN